MSLKLITPNSDLVVSLAQLKLHLKVDISDEDGLITAMAMAAQERAEQKTHRALLAQTWELTLDAFPNAFELTRVPVISITSVQYIDTTGTLQVLSSSQYVLDNANDFSVAYVVPAYGAIWPDTRQQVNAVKVRYVSGYDAAASVPESIKSWIKLQVGAMYENRAAEGETQTYQLGFADRLLDRYTLHAL